MPQTISVPPCIELLSKLHGMGTISEDQENISLPEIGEGRKNEALKPNVIAKIPN